MVNYIYIAVIFLGGLIQGATGFGFALIAMSVLPFFIGLTDLTVIIVILGIALNISILIGLKGGANLKLMIIPLITAIIGRHFGAVMLMRYNSQYLRVLLSLVIILISIYFIFFGRVKIKPTRINGSICGTMSGVLGGLYSIPGPPLVVYFISTTEESREYSATIQVTIAFSSLYSLWFHFINNNISIYIIKMSLIGIVAVTLGSMIGIMLFKRINREILKKMIYCILIIMGFATMFNIF